MALNGCAIKPRQKHLLVWLAVDGKQHSRGGNARLALACRLLASWVEAHRPTMLPCRVRIASHGHSLRASPTPSHPMGIFTFPLYHRHTCMTGPSAACLHGSSCIQSLAITPRPPPPSPLLAHSYCHSEHKILPCMRAGSIRDLRVYDQRLTDEQQTALYAELHRKWFGAPQKCEQQCTWWPMPRRMPCVRPLHYP